MVIDNEVVCIIYVGNILTSDGYKKMMQKNPDCHELVDTMEKNADYKKCDEIGMLIESYIRMLLDNCAKERCVTNSLVRNIRDYIAYNLEYDMSICDISNMFHYNNVYIGRLFKKETGFTIKEYINHERINYAKELLIKTDDSVIEISLKSGFNNVTYFNRIFKKYIGCTPSEFRSKNSEKHKVLGH